MLPCWENTSPVSDTCNTCLCLRTLLRDANLSARTPCCPLPPCSPLSRQSPRLRNWGRLSLAPTVPLCPAFAMRLFWVRPQWCHRQTSERFAASKALKAAKPIHNLGSLCKILSPLQQSRRPPKRSNEPPSTKNCQRAMDPGGMAWPWWIKGIHSPLL